MCYNQDDQPTGSEMLLNFYILNQRTEPPFLITNGMGLGNGAQFGNGPSLIGPSLTIGWCCFLFVAGLWCYVGKNPNFNMITISICNID